MRSKREMQMTLFGSLDMVAFVSHLNWHSFVIKIQYVFFLLHGKLSMVDSLRAFSVEFSRSYLASELSVTSSTLFSVTINSHYTSSTTHFQRIISEIFSFPRRFIGKIFLSPWIFFLYLVNCGGIFFLSKAKKLYFELQQKCVIYNYSFSNPVRLPVAELQLDSSFCKLIQSLRFVALFPSRNFF